MTQEMQTQIAAAIRELQGKSPGISADRLCGTLRAKTRRLRQYYIKANSGKVRAPQEEWLCDNYYVLEKESKQSVKDIRHISAKAGAGELERFYQIFHHVLTGLRPPICDESVTAVLKAAGEQKPVSEVQFSAVPALIKAVLVDMAYTACMEEHSEDKISYAIIGLSRLGAVDVESIIQQCSRVEGVLMQDPAGVYAQMDSDSRQYYRHLVAVIAGKTGKREEEVAEEMLRACRSQPEGEPGRHIGWPILHSPHIRGPRLGRGRAAILLGILLPLVLSLAIGVLCRNVWLVFLTYLPLWEIVRTPLQQLALSGVDVDFIPKMNLKKVVDKPKTVVLVSTLLPKAGDAPHLKQRLEQLYFSNSDPDMYYCILADFGECDFPTDEKDESQIAATRRVIEALNQKHGERFMLFLRGRTFNKTQGRYTGWERKRGAITEFARFLKGDKVSLHTFVGDRSVLPKIRYAIALDADTNLLYESAQTLVAAAIHPLNRPVCSDEGVVTGGYGILAPKISTDLESARRTPFSRVMTGCGGVTAYDTRDKDFYQDFFAESIFAGKGLIDMDCFYRLLDQRFPENQILSHDILEGAYLRVGFVSDAEMTDGAPQSMTSWLARLHRWIRGDWQNICFVARSYRAGGKEYPNPINTLSKYKLFDNLRRSLTPVAALLCLLAALFSPSPQAAVLVLVGVLATTFASLWAAGWSLFTGGFFTMSRKFFTRTLPHTFELITQGLFFLIMLPVQSFVTVDAAVRALWRLLVSRKKLLEWTTAAQGDMRGVNLLAVLKRYWVAELFGLGYLLFASHNSIVSLPGLVFALLIPVAYYSARPSHEDRHTLSGSQRDTLISYNAAMWRYYEDFANKENHYLPPDNIQQSPVFRVANRTSPTNIGMLLLSTLAARDMDFIDTNGLYLRIERTISAVEGLKMWHGNLYNWYDTSTLDTLKPEFVSTVDSGNFVCCLVALAQGLSEFVQEKREFEGLIARIEALVENTDLTRFYNKKKRLFSIGYDVDTDTLSDSHYDFLMSEARLTSYFAVARKTVGKKHWGTLNRTMSRCGSYAGAVSWTGTMFEYYMPHLLLPVYEGSLLGEALLYCLYCQKRRVKGMDVPWGISESAFYAFDNNLNYQYKAHGVQKIGVKRYLDRELVISPYSTFITIPFNPNSSMDNLSHLRELGVYGRYGFYEAVDFTAERVGSGSLAVTRSYMAHHIGMSMVSSCNALFENRMQKRFMRDNTMKSAKEFLQEKITKNTVVYDSLHSGENREKSERSRIVLDESNVISPLSPRCAVLTNGELTDILTDTGAGYLKFGDVDLTRRSDDLLRRPQGMVVLAKTGNRVLPLTQSPFYDNSVEYRVEFGEKSVTYYAGDGDMELGMRCLVHPTISCQQRQLVLKNTSSQRQSAELLVYFEPILCQYRDYNAHPAYSKLFVGAGFDEDTKTLTFCRRKRDGTIDMYLTVGFLQELDFSYETRREALMSAPNGLGELREFAGKPFSNNGGGVPDACCALRFHLSAPAGGQAGATLLLCASRTRTEGIEGIISMRKIGLLQTKNASKSPLLGDSLESRLGCALLGQLLFGQGRQEDATGAKEKNRLGQSGLWCTGISGDLPIVLLELEEDYDATALQAYIRLHRTLHSLQVEFDLCIVCGQGDDLEAMVREQVTEGSVHGILGSRGGIFLLQAESLAAETLVLLRAVCRHRATGTMPDLTPAELPPYRPMALQPARPAPMPEKPELEVEGGAFHEGRFWVDKHSPLPYSHVLANPAFGTLVSDKALGYTWAVNSRENKLTPWYNDICTDNTGELLLLREGDGAFDLINGSRASFSAQDARYQGEAAGLESHVRVTVSRKGCAKYVDVRLRNKTPRSRELHCAYYTEPVLGVDRSTSRYIRPELHGNEGPLVLQNAYNTAVACCAALSATSSAGEKPSYTTVRWAFLCGDWKSLQVAGNNDPCAAAVVPVKLEPGQEVELRFALGYGKTPDSAAYMVTRPLPEADGGNHGNSIQIRTPDEAMNQYINHFAMHQVAASRIWGRTAFYQCGGAYGFRDQLQDTCTYLLLDPDTCRRQIVRCCGVQFEEGDVLHWWHPLPKSGGGLRGVRTRFSDDLLWLPYTVALYLERTGDRSILDVTVHYLTAPPLEPGVQETYIAPEKSGLRDDVYGHCVRALERGWNLDERGLPYIGCGDWCDGFSAVGAEGKGVSIWLALFLAMTLDRFAQVCDIREDAQRGSAYRQRAEKLRRAVDEYGWDGKWYLRAFFDSGEPMGSAGNSECAIDALAQSFAVFAGMPDRERVNQGLDSAVSRLVDQKLRLVRLFDPPFRHSHQKPGYVKAYPAGIRENGGQYTHGAIWFAIALLEAGRVEEGAAVLQMLCPADRAGHPQMGGRYGLEPYYIAADVYTNEHVPGRGGWSLYTGAAAWYYRGVVEYLLGMRRMGDRLLFCPRIPAGWEEARLELCLDKTQIKVALAWGAGPPLVVDGREAEHVPLDGTTHNVVVRIPLSPDPDSGDKGI